MNENTCNARSYFPNDPVYKRSKIMDHYGIQAQLFKMIEELTEAQTEVIKMVSGKPDKSIDHLIEELADVALMTDQIVEHYGMRGKFDEVYAYKLNRTLERIEGEKQ